MLRLATTSNSILTCWSSLRWRWRKLQVFQAERADQIETVGGVERATLQSSHITEWLFVIEMLKEESLNS